MPTRNKRRDDLDYDAPRRLLREVCNRQPWNMQSLSLAIGQGKTYIRDFVIGKSHKAKPLPEEVRKELARVLDRDQADFLPVSRVTDGESIINSLSRNGPPQSPSGYLSVTPEARQAMFDKLIMDHNERIRELEVRLHALEERLAGGAERAARPNPQKRV